MDMFCIFYGLYLLSSNIVDFLVKGYAA